MPTTRTPIGRPPINRITPEAVEAWKRCDYTALHLLLRLRPWDSSPLPKEIAGGLGVDQDDLLDFDPETASPADQSLPKIVAIQAELLAIAGWPDGARAAYEENLAKAIDWAKYCRELVRHPERGGQGTRCDPKSRREDLEEAEADVEYRRELLTDLPQVQKKWAREVGVK